MPLSLESPRADVFAAIASEPRRALLDRLSAGDTPVSELAESMNMSLSAVSQHLSVLKDAHLVETIKAGKQRIYRLRPEPLQHVNDWLARYEPFWQDKLQELGKVLEENR